MKLEKNVLAQQSIPLNNKTMNIFQFRSLNLPQHCKVDTKTAKKQIHLHQMESICRTQPRVRDQP